MTDRLPTVTSRQLVRALEQAGFQVVRSSGSHHRLVHKDDPRRATTVPVHPGRDLGRPLVRAILRQAGLSVEDFIKLL